MALPLPCLMLVTDRSLCGGPDGLVEAVRETVEGGANAVQLREKDMPDGELLPLARRLREVTRGRAVFLVNGSLQVARDAGAEGIHLPEDAPTVERPRDSFLVGRSVHSLGAARSAEAEGADYLIAGPVYETRSHPGAPPAGVSLVREIAAVVRVPVLAIGGVTADRAGEVVGAGASGVAVISALLASDDRRSAAAELRRVLDAAWAATGARP